MTTTPDTLATAPFAPGRPCDQCGGFLSGKQERFCSRACSSSWWDAQHPRINRGPAGPREGTIKALILGLMADGQWRTEQEIADAIHAFAHTVGARLSELRKRHPIERDPPHRGGGVHRYRLVGRE